MTLRPPELATRDNFDETQYLLVVDDEPDLRRQIRDGRSQLLVRARRRRGIGQAGGRPQYRYSRDRY